MSTVKIAPVAYQGTYDFDLNVKTHIEQIEALVAQGADLIVFPEISLQGYPPGLDRVWPGKILDAYQNAERVPDGPGTSAILDAAQRAGTHVIFGLTELEDSTGAVYNTIVLGGPDGYIGKYRKVHLALSEAALWRDGHDWPVFNTAIGKIGMLICYDIRWPEACRELTLRGAEILVHSSAVVTDVFPGSGDTGGPFCRAPVIGLVRAAENNRWFVSCNFGGNLGEAAMDGGAFVVAPTGKLVASTSAGEVGATIAEIDVKAGIAEANAAMFGARLVRDRRPDTYKAISGELPIAIDA